MIPLSNALSVKKMNHVPKSLCATKNTEKINK